MLALGLAPVDNDFGGTIFALDEHRAALTLDAFIVLSLLLLLFFLVSLLLLLLLLDGRDIDCDCDWVCVCVCDRDLSDFFFGTVNFGVAGMND